MHQRPPGVLVVDDDFVVLEIVSAVFRQAGLTVHAASSGEAGLTLLRDLGAQIDWLFTDINLPGLVDGCELADAYRSRYPTRPIVYTSAAEIADLRTVEGSLFVRKPLRPAEIRRIAETMHLAAGPFRAPAEDRDPDIVSV